MNFYRPHCRLFGLEEIKVIKLHEVALGAKMLNGRVGREACHIPDGTECLLLPVHRFVGASVSTA